MRTKIYSKVVNHRIWWMTHDMVYGYGAIFDGDLALSKWPHWSLQCRSGHLRLNCYCKVVFGWSIQFRLHDSCQARLTRAFHLEWLKLLFFVQVRVRRTSEVKVPFISYFHSSLSLYGCSSMYCFQSVLSAFTHFLSWFQCSKFYASGTL